MNPQIKKWFASVEDGGRKKGGHTTVSRSLESEPLKDVAHGSFRHYFQQDQGRKIVVICCSFTALHSLKIIWTYSISPTSTKFLSWTKQCNCTFYVLYIHIFIYFIEEITQGKALFWKRFYVNEIWKILHSVCPGWIPNMSTHISENSSQGSSSSLEHNTLLQLRTYYYSCIVCRLP